MKKYLLLGLISLGVVAGKSQTLITYGKYNVGKQEFLRAYNKNKAADSAISRDKAIRDYVELYTNFKMKVQAALEMRLDTLSQIQSDLSSFRQQVEENYMNDELTFKNLMTEAFNRSQSDLHLVRYSISVSENDLPEDTLKKYKVVQELYEQLKSGKADNITLNDFVKKVDMGFVTVFSLPYAYENIAYSLQPGQVAKPYRTKKSWHIFKLVEKRKSAGKWKVAQILFTSPDNADEATKARAAKLADSVYQLLQKGSDFASMARLYSDDKLTYLSGGEMPEFGTGKYDMAFENQVVKLSKDGDYSSPFKTDFGIHIVKRLSYTAIPSSLSDETFAYELKQKLLQDDRVKIAKEKFAKDVLMKIGFVVSPAVKEADILRYADTAMSHSDMSDAATTTTISDKVIVNMKGGKLKGSDWLTFVLDYKSNSELYKNETNAELWQQFKKLSALDFYKKHLETYNDDFKYQLQEFREGNLLFEIMERNVWSKAGKDSVGLKEYYNQHRAQYTWGPSADVLVVNAVNETLAQEMLDSLNAGKSWKQMVDIHQGELQADSSRFELAQLNYTNDIPAGKYTTITRNPDGTATFMKYFRFYPDGDGRSFEDAKGMVINDYQMVVEKKWIEELKKKYQPKVNEALLKLIISGK